MNPVREGATVCGSCGAYEEWVANPWIGLASVVFVSIPILILSMGITEAMHNAIPSFIGFPLAIFLPVLISKRFRKKLWLHRR